MAPRLVNSWYFSYPLYRLRQKFPVIYGITGCRLMLEDKPETRRITNNFQIAADTGLDGFSHGHYYNQPRGSQNNGQNYPNILTILPEYLSTAYSQEIRRSHCLKKGKPSSSLLLSFEI